MSKWKIAALVVAVAAMALSLLNASWIAPKPKGPFVLVADRGLVQPSDAGPGACSARIRPSENAYVENSLSSLRRATSLGARAVAIDVQRTRDGHLVVFSDETLECRTNGSGPVGGQTLAQLKALDAGYRYTADGRAFPLRGRGIGAIPTVEEVLRELPQTPLIVSFKGSDPAAADALVAAFQSAGVAIAPSYGFRGDAAVTGRLRQLVPGAWIIDAGASQACFGDYLTLGWAGIVPASCRDTTIVVPLDRRWILWGWPYRFLDRMAGAGSQVILVGGVGEGGAITGIDRLDQIPQVPRHYRGHLLVGDMHGVGAAIRR